MTCILYKMYFKINICGCVELINLHYFLWENSTWCTNIQFVVWGGGGGDKFIKLFTYTEVQLYWQTETETENKVTQLCAFNCRTGCRAWARPRSKLDQQHKQTYNKVNSSQLYTPCGNVLTSTRNKQVPLQVQQWIDKRKHYDTKTTNCRKPQVVIRSQWSWLHRDWVILANTTTKN